MIKKVLQVNSKLYNYFFQLESSFSSAKDSRMVEYKAFCAEIEKAFSNDELEKNPLVEAVQHVPSDPVHSNKLLPDEVQSVDRAMSLIAERVTAT